MNRTAGLFVVCGCAVLLRAGHLAAAAGLFPSPSPPAYVVAHWRKEFAAVETEIKEKREFYERGEDPYEKERILDRHFRILPNDRTAFDVEYRRTCALLNALEEAGGIRSIGDLRSQLNAAVRDRDAASGVSSREQAMSDYFQVAALRRKVAMSNPLLDFDTLLFVGRGNYYGDDPTGQHQLSGPIAFCNRVGGGLYMVKNFKADARIVDVLAHSVVENGSYKDWKLSGKGPFYSPELSYDGQTILFSWSENRIGRERAGWGLGTVGPIHRWPPRECMAHLQGERRWHGIDPAD